MMVDRILNFFPVFRPQDRSSQRQELVGVMYDTNVLGFKGPLRMTVVLPGMTAEGTRMAFKASSSHDGLIEANEYEVA